MILQRTAVGVPRKGFTLIEMLIYLGLFALIMTAALEAALAISESSSRDTAHAYLQEEGSFLLGKINWLIGQGIAVQAPAPGTRGQSISILENDRSVFAITLSKKDGSLSLTRDGERAVRLSDSGVRASALSFEHVAGVRDGIPEHVDIAFMLTATSSIGMPVDSMFTETVYVP